MGLKFNDEDDQKPAIGNYTGDGSDSSLLDRLRNLIKSTDSMDVNDPKALENMVGKENAATIGRVQKRIDELVNAAHGFLEAKEKGDPTKAMMDFMRLIQDTCIKYTAIEIGSIMSTGIVGLATLEKTFGIKPEGFDDNNDNNDN